MAEQSTFVEKRILLMGGGAEGFLSSRLESFTRAKVRKIVIQMEISSSLVIFTFIITTNVFILISTTLLGR